MTDLKICRICLRTEAKVYNYEQFQLKSYYEEVLGLKINEIDDLPRYFCFECATILHKFHKFKEKCFSGKKVLKEMLSKGPAGIKELLKLSTNTSSQETEVVEHPFLDTDVNTKDLPISNPIFSDTDPIEIDSFFINNLDIVLEDEQMLENMPLSNICSESLHDFKEPIINTESDILISNNNDLNIEKLTETEPLPILICEIPSGDQILNDSDLEYIEEINKNPTEDLEGIDNESSSILYCDLDNLSPVFSPMSPVCDSNLEGIELDLASNNITDLNEELKSENTPTPIVYYEMPNTNLDFQDPIIEYLETDLESSNGELTAQNETSPCGLPSTSEVFSVGSIDFTELDESSQIAFNLNNNIEVIEKELNDKYIDAGPPAQENVTQVCLNSLVGSEFQIINKDIRERKVKVATKNQLAPNIHSVLPTTSQEYFETNAEPDEENVNDKESINQLEVQEESCVEVKPPKAKRNRRKYPFSKRVKPSPCHKKCGNRCSVLITEVERLVIHERFWKMEKKEQQEWLVSCIKPKRIRRRQGQTFVKNISYDYFINHKDKNIKVCQQFLMKTLDVSQMRFRYALTKLAPKEDFSSSDSDSDLSLSSQES